MSSPPSTHAAAATAGGGGVDDDDLDALLDEAMDIVDAQERQHEAHVKARDAELDQKLQAALQDGGSGDGSSGGGGDEMAWLGEMMRTVEELKTSLSDDMDETAFATLKGKIDGLLQRVEASGLMTGEDKGDVTSVKTLLDMLGNDPQQTEQLAQALGLDKLPEGGDTAAAAAVARREGDDDDGDDADSSSSAAQLRAALEQLKANPEHFAEEARQMLAARAAAAAATPGASATHATPPTTSSSTTTAGAATATTTGATPRAAAEDVSDVADAMKDNLAKMLMTTFRDPQFVEPVRVMRDAYARWLQAHDAELSDADKERYRKQHAMTIAICDFLAVPLSDEDDERMLQLMEMMHEFSQLGEPPSDLPTYNGDAATAA